MKKISISLISEKKIANVIQSSRDQWDEDKLERTLGSNFVANTHGFVS